ncbi:bifunctional tail protein [Escherichia coli 174750]|uniref:phage head-binding domain-containing protein n=1 Tax=Escherichia coli TaxID=562 RepID=UPI0002C90ADE|nr:phage head-binding domain-containing protein [Escherichia coli]EMX09772.1 bifunctional tail protein [Escherichia coli 174750]
MTDITANVVVSMPSQLFTMARSFKAVANGKIYIGKIDTDPVNPENQIQVCVENEDGSHVPVSQPIIINAAGYPVYNGQIAKFVTVQGHSMAVYDAYGAQQFYFPNVLKYDPDQLRQELATEGNEILVDDSRIAVKSVHVNSKLRTQHNKNAEIITPNDFISNYDMISAAINSGDSAAVFNSRYAFTITVGEYGNFKSISDALNSAVALRPLWKNGIDFCIIKILSGFVLNEQIEISAGCDLSWIKIISEDSVVFSDTSLFTKTVRTYYEYKYLFYICDAAKSPVFAIQIEENRDDSDVCAFIVTQKAELNFYPYSGARKFYVGIHGSFGAKISAYHTGCAPDEESVAAYMPEGYYVCDFSYSRYSSLQLVNNVKASMPVSKFERCTESTVASVNCIYNVKADFQGSSASYCYIGWNVRDGSNVNIRDHKTIHCSYRGLTCIHTAYVDARRHDVEESDAETSGKVLEPNIEKGFYGCALGVRIDGAGCVDVAGNDMRNCGTAVNADTGAVISGKAVDISGAELGFDCHAGASVNFPRLWGTDIKKLMHLQDGVRFNSNICHVFGANPTKDIRWIDVERSEASFMNATLDADSGFIADCGSRITIEGSKVKNQTIRSFFGSHVAINNTVADRTYSDIADVPQLTISGGSFISATGYSNSDSSPLRLSTTRNTLGVGGAIFSTNGEVS